MNTQALGEIKLLDSPEQTISLLWTFRDKRVKYELGSNVERWPMEIYNCIQFTKVLEGLRHFYPQLKERYFFKAESKLLYGPKTFCISYDQSKRLMIVKTGLTFQGPNSVEVDGVVDFTYHLSRNIDSMIYQMQRGLPSGLAKSLLQECKNLSNNIAVRSSFLKDL